jgi:hypothetical protein
MQTEPKAFAPSTRKFLIKYVEINVGVGNDKRTEELKSEEFQTCF